MEGTPVSAKVGEGPLQDNLHAAQHFDEEGIIGLSKERVVENEGGIIRGSSEVGIHLKEIEKVWSRARCSRMVPSHERTLPWGTSHETIKPHVQAPITRSSVPGRSVVIVRTRPYSGQENPRVIDIDEEIVEEEAVCKFCFDVFKDENTLKTVCRCKNALIHEECAAKWQIEKGDKNCDFCGEKVQNIPVILLRGRSSIQRVDTKESLFSWLTR